MEELEYFKDKCKKYNLTLKEISEDTLYIYSKKYFFDSWLIKKTEDNEFELWHQNKKNNPKKCNYHLQLRVKRNNRAILVYTINSHNKYAAFYRNTKNINLVDRVLKKR